MKEVSGVQFMRHICSPMQSLHQNAGEVKVSVDYGNCWYTVPLDTALFVDNIR